jgi:hypothetical protein
MRQGSNSEALALWDGLFPGKIPQDLVLADPLPDHTIELEGHDLVAVQLGRTDTDETTCLHVPEIGLVVATEILSAMMYINTFVSPSGQREWLAASTPSNPWAIGPTSNAALFLRSWSKP